MSTPKTRPSPLTKLPTFDGDRFIELICRTEEIGEPGGLDSIVDLAWDSGNAHERALQRFHDEIVLNLAANFADGDSVIAHFTAHLGPMTLRSRRGDEHNFYWLFSSDIPDELVGLVYRWCGRHCAFVTTTDDAERAKLLCSAVVAKLPPLKVIQPKWRLRCTGDLSSISPAEREERSRLQMTNLNSTSLPSAELR